MKSKYLLISIITLTASSFANAATIYKNDDSSFDITGRLQAHYVTVNGSNSDKSELQSKARLRTKGSVKIADGIKAIEFTEWEVGAATSQKGKFDTRYAFLGFQTDNYGQLTFGQDDTALYEITGNGNVYFEWGNIGNTYWELGGRQEGQIKYKIDSIANSGLNFAATYQSASLPNVDTGFATAITYTFNDSFPIDIGVGYDHYELTNNADDRSSIASSITAGTNGDGLYLAGIYQYTDYNKQKNKHSFEIISSYTTENNLKGILSYRNQRQDGATLISSVLGEIDYFFTPNFLVFTEFEFGIGDIDKVNKQGEKVGSTNKRSGDKALVGIQYNF